MSLHSQDKLISNLRDRDYRSAFVSSRINNFLAFQIRALRQKKEWSQIELAKRLKTSQNAVSRMENPSYGKHSITTLKRLGEIFDVGVVVWFVPFSELIKKVANLSTENVIIPSFEEEFGTSDQKDVEFQKEEKEEEQPAITRIWDAFQRFLSKNEGVQLADFIYLRENNVVMQPPIPADTEPKIPQPRSRQALPHDIPTFGNPSASGSRKMPVEAHP